MSLPARRAKQSHGFMRSLRLAFGGLAMTLLCFLYPTPAMAAKEGRPNIIIFLVDTLRADYLGCYGFKGRNSPNIDAFAKESFLFSNCVTQAPWTKPATASLFTSLHPQTHGVRDHISLHSLKKNGNYKMSILSDKALTLAEVLQSAGYETYGFVGNDFLIKQFGYAQGFQQYFEPRPNTDFFSAATLLNKSKDILEKRSAQKPFFMYFHFMDVHGPYQVDEKDFKASLESPSLGRDMVLSKTDRKGLPHEFTSTTGWLGPHRSQRLKNWRACYAAGIRRFDRRLGDFLGYLKREKFLDNTLIVFMADHGEELYDHRGWAHSHSLYKELLHIPLLIRLPKGKNGGTMIPESVNIVDVMPTLMRQARIPETIRGIIGRDLSPLLEGKRIKGLGWAYATALRHNLNKISVQNNQYKLIWDYPDGERELFDLKSDPDERNNIAAEKSKVVRRLSQMVVRHLQEVETQGTLSEATVPISGPLVEKLKSLGYLQ